MLIKLQDSSDEIKPSFPSILVCDSGVGGLSIVNSITENIANCSISFLADSAGFPYGAKTDQWLSHRLLALIKSMLDQIEPDLIVIGCNTASTLVLSQLRDHFKLPFVGVVPAIKPAAQLSKTKKIILLATKATVYRPYIDKLISDYGNGCDFIRVGNQQLVELAELKLTGKTVSPEEIKEALEFTEEKIGLVDTGILGCTHFPLLINEIQQAYPKIHWIHSGSAIAKRVKYCLSQNQVVSNAKSTNYSSQLFDDPINSQNTKKSFFTSTEKVLNYYYTGKLSTELEKSLTFQGFQEFKLLKNFSDYSANQN